MALPAVRPRAGRRLPLGELQGRSGWAACFENISELAARPPPHLQGYGSGGGGDGLPSPHDLRSTLQPRGSSSSLVLYTNATVWVGDAAGTQVEAFLVDAATGRFAFVGDRTGALAAAAQAQQQQQPAEVDLQGAHVIPGEFKGAL